MFGLDFHAISIYCLHRALYKIHKLKLFAYLSLGDNKSGRKSLVEKKAKIIQCAFIIKKKYLDVSRLQPLYHQRMIAFN